METTLSRDELMKAMLAEQAAREKKSKDEMKNKPKPVVANSFGGVTRVFRTVNPEDLKPNPFRTVTEDVVANAEDEGGKFEKRKDEGVGR